VIIAGEKADEIGVHEQLFAPDLQLDMTGESVDGIDIKTPICR
jgi:hypothetical protein